MVAEAVKLNRARGRWDRQRLDYSRRLAAVAVALNRSYAAVRHEAAALQRRQFV